MYMTCIRGLYVIHTHTHWPTYIVESHLHHPALSRWRRRRLANHVFGNLSIFSTDNVRSARSLVLFGFFSLSVFFYCFFFSFSFSLTHSLCSPSLSIARKFTACASCVSFLFQFFLCSDSVLDLVLTRQKVRDSNDIMNNQLDNSLPLLDAPRNATPTLTRRHACSMLPIFIDVE